MNFRHIKKSDDLITSKEKIKEGFIKIALEKRDMATPYVKEGRALKSATSGANKASDLLNIESILDALLTAAGLSDKAINHLDNEAKLKAANMLIKEVLEPSNNFSDELVYRFLLTKGDSLGGSIRNVVGSFAEKTIKESIIAALSIHSMKFYLRSKEFKKWSENKTLPARDIDAISWSRGKITRTILFNKNVPIIKKNVDLCLLDSDYASVNQCLKDSKKYIALGEIKGGIDPAGADEHWKTARSSIERIVKGFKPHVVKTFFIGAAVEAAMSKEIWDMLQNEKLSNAGNLTNCEHVASICEWLIQQ